MFTDNLQSLLVARVRASPPGASLKQSLEGCIKEVEGLLVLTCNQLNFLCEQTVSTCDGVSEDDSSTDTDFETGSLPLLQIMSVESGGPIIDIEYVLPEPFTSIVALARGPPAGPPPPGNKRNLFKKLAAIGTPRTSPSPAMPAPQPVGPQLITFVAESPEVCATEQAPIELRDTKQTVLLVVESLPYFDAINL